MKDQKILILLMFSFMFTSCGITFPYLNEQNETFDKIYKGKIYIDENISRTCFEFDVVASKFLAWGRYNNYSFTFPDIVDTVDFTEKDQAFYQEKGFPPPKRCHFCRKARKEKHLSKNNNEKY